MGFSRKRSFPLILIAFFAFGWPCFAEQNATDLWSDSKEMPLQPVSIEEIEPCCEVGEEVDPGYSARRPAVKPEGLFFSEETFKMLKRQAEYDPRLPAGEELPEKVPFQAQAPIIRMAFDGINSENAVEDGSIPIPPDTIVAAGPNTILEATNSVLRLSNKENGNVSFQSLRNHFKTRDDYFDPRVYYDRLSQRFIIVALIFKEQPRKSAIFLSISRSPNPTSLSTGWCNYRMNGNRSGSWADYPGLGVNENLLAITTNQFTFTDFTFRSVIVKAVKKNIFNNAGSCPKINVSTFEVRDGVSFTLMPATHLTPNNLSGTPLFLVSNLNGFSNLYQVWRLSGNPPQLSHVQLEGPNFSLPPNGRQKGGGISLDSGDNRILQSVFRSGQLWATHNTGCALGSAAQTEACVRVIRFTPTDASATISYDKTFGLSNQYFFYPSIGVNQAGDVAAVFQRSSQNMFLSSAIAGKRASSQNFDKIAPLRNGACHYELVPAGASNRTGDYTGTQVDPSDDRSFWVAAEYSVRIPGFTKCVWGTRIAKISY